jgi:hypothetical protein
MRWGAEAATPWEARRALVNPGLQAAACRGRGGGQWGALSGSGAHRRFPPPLPRVPSLCWARGVKEALQQRLPAVQHEGAHLGPLLGDP